MMNEDLHVCQNKPIVKPIWELTMYFSIEFMEIMLFLEPSILSAVTSIL